MNDDDLHRLEAFWRAMEAAVPSIEQVGDGLEVLRGGFRTGAAAALGGQMIKVEHTRLILREPHNNVDKFYALFRADDGRILRHYGRNMTNGQIHEERYGALHVHAKAHQLIQEKKNKGYHVIANEFFEVDDKLWGDPGAMLRARSEVTEEPPVGFNGGNPITELLDRASELLVQPGGHNLMAEAAQLRVDYEEMVEQLETAKAAIDMLTRKVLQ